MPAWLRASVQAAGPDEAPLALLRLWWAPPSEIVDRHQLGPRREDSFALRYVASDGGTAAPIFSPENGPVYTDGSALFTSLGGLAIAAFAAVQLRGTSVGCAWVGLTGQVPGYLNQTAAAAERLALATATLSPSLGGLCN